MSTKSAIVLSAAILIGTAAAGVAKQHPFTALVRAEPGIVRSAPEGELHGISLHSSEEALAFQQGSRMFLTFPRLR
jgi:hypothetical protein